MAQERKSEWTFEKAQLPVPVEATDIDAEIAYCEERLKVLAAAKTQGPKQDWPRYVYKAVEKPAASTQPVVYESQLVNSEEELKACGAAGWGDHPAGEKSAKSAKGEANSGAYDLDGNVSDIATHVARMTDADALKALKAQERKGKARQGVYDVIDARLAELKERG